MLPSALLVVVRSGSLPSLGRCDGGRCPWAVFASVGPRIGDDGLKPLNVQ